MKRIFKILGLLFLVLVVIAAGIVAYVTFFLPHVPLEKELVIEATPARLKRGAYLANNVMGCMDCHASRDMNYFAGPFFEETRGTGGEEWTRKMGVPGYIVSKNITPYALSDWTDAELFRAITAGVSKDGTALMPMMPWHQYGRLPREDIYAVIAYLRTLEPKPMNHKTRELDFPVNLIVNTMPRPGKHDLAPNPADPVAHGEYMITASVCYDCHTPMKDGQFIESLAFAGGSEFQLPTGGVVRSANLTPDMKTGIGGWSRELFINRFASFRDSVFTPHRVEPGQFNSFMPWTYYARMKDEDIGAIYDYLMSLDPIENQVEKFTPPDQLQAMAD